MNINRRSIIAGSGASALALVLSACGAKEAASTASSSASASKAVSSAVSTASASASAAVDSVVSQLKPAGRKDDGYHMTPVVDGAPTITLFTDYQCPYCAKAEPAFEKAALELQGTANMVVRNFPLPMHKNAIPAAYAVMAAEQQGKRQEFSDKLFKTQPEWEQISDSDKLLEKYKGYASELGLNPEQLATDFAKTDLRKIVETDYNDAMSLKLSGTPSFLVNGKEATDVNSAMSADQMVAAFKKLAGL